MIATYFKRKSREEGLKARVDFLDVDVRDNISTVLHHVLVKQPDILGIGVYCWNVDVVRSLIKALRTLKFSGVIVLGGPEITYRTPMELRSDFEGVDYFIRGDGEQAFYCLVKSLIHGWTPIHEGLIPGMDLLVPIESHGLASIDELTSPYPELADVLIGKGFARWQTQRGCSYRCSFCAFPNAGKTIKYLSLEEVRRDLETFKERGVKEVALLDPVFFLKKSRAVTILQLMKQIAPDIRYEIQTRLEHLDETVLAALEGINVVLEAGIQTLNQIVSRKIRRNAREDRLLQGLQLVKARQLKLEVHLIAGLPEQTFDSFMQDLIFLVTMGVPVIRTFPLSLLHGTELALDESFTKSCTFSPLFPREVIETPWMTREDLLFVKVQLQEFLERYNSPRHQWKNEGEINDNLALLSGFLLKLFRDQEKEGVLDHEE